MRGILNVVVSFRKIICMLNNHIYNLLNQTTQEHKSLWRIKSDYREDAKDCAECSAFWEKMEKDKEVHVAELEQMIKKHL